MQKAQAIKLGLLPGATKVAYATCSERRTAVCINCGRDTTAARDDLQAIILACCSISLAPRSIKYQKSRPLIPVSFNRRLCDALWQKYPRNSFFSIRDTGNIAQADSIKPASTGSSIALGCD
ncbi:hypothetical protein ABH313_18460 [Chromobacterium vaccinii]|uniref:hypothetical protein n=1 Tax=Chromobacterium vaccinii TaxID=1108595 RepID=UPI0032609410